MNGGAKTWFFPDGYLPEKLQNGTMEAHEALMLLNTGNKPADVRIDVYFEDREPAKDITTTVAAERVKTLRLDHPEELGGLEIPPLIQYSLRVRANKNIVVQFGRLDTTQNNMAYYGVAGYYE
ncbi:MAG: sensory rhodopsin transducer [Victivallales bacterium]|nr:sensory rhodopsin transducer [Victivallales bacterium]